MAVNAFANGEEEITRNTYAPKEAITNSSQNQTRESYSYLADNSAPADWVFDLTISGGSTWWRNLIRDGMDNWYSTNTGAIISEDDASRNEANVVAADDTWLGLYTAYIYTSSGNFSRFHIQINTNTLPGDNSEYVLSTTTHELGHALHLADNPLPDDANGSLMNHGRDRNNLNTPTDYDEDAVNNYYDSVKSAGSLPAESGEDEMDSLVADYVQYSDVRDMIGDADLIVKCKVLNSAQEKSLDVGLDIELPYTISVVEVSETFKGEASVGDKLEVKQLGGENMNVKDTVYLADGEYLLFLQSYDDSPYSIINPVQGQYLVEDNQFKSVEGNELSLEKEMLD